MDRPFCISSDTRVCVLGGSGFLGTHIIGQLLARGAKVRTRSLAAPAPELAGKLDVLVGDITDLEAVRKAIDGAHIVFNLVAPVYFHAPAPALVSAHLQGIRCILDALPSGMRLVHTSSVVAIGGTATPEVLSEESGFRLDNSRIGYVRAKRAAEQEVLAAAARGNDIVAVNPGYVFGPDDIGPSLMSRLAQRFWRGRIPVAPSGGINCVDVRDVAAGHLLAAEQGGCGRRYILGGENVTMHDFLKMMANTAGFTPRMMPWVPTGLLLAFAAGARLRGRLRGREPFPSVGIVRLLGMYWFASSARAQTELGYWARPLRETIVDTFAWHSTQQRFELRGVNRWLLRPTS